MQRRAVVALSIILIAAGGAFAYMLSRRSAPSYQFTQVTLGSIDQEVLASGDVESPSAVLLYFKNSGTLESLPVAIGERVKVGETLASEDSAAQSAQLAEAEAALAQQTAILQKIQTGPRPESIAVAKASVEIAKQALQKCVRECSFGALGCKCKSKGCGFDSNRDLLFEWRYRRAFFELL
jgi:macrolide-specific efflux system membrane fusion protein